MSPCLIFTSLFRTAEVSIASNKASTWNNTEQALDANWSMLKTVKEKTVTICPDRISPYCCFYSTYFIYMMLGSIERYRPQEAEEDFPLFPSMWSHSSPVRKVNETLKLVRESRYTGTSIRSGVIHDIIAHVDIKLHDVVMSWS